MSYQVLASANRRTVRAVMNPLDKSTVVSIYPRAIHEVKSTIQPGTFDIEAGSLKKPAILVVSTSSWWKELGDDQPLLEIPNSSIQVADSIVNDYCNGIECCNMGDCMPGLFFIPGEHNLLDVVTNYQMKLDAAQKRQRNWYHVIVKQADSMWARSNGNPLAISEIAKMAAHELNLNDKEWLKDTQITAMVRCTACGTLKNPNYPVCSNCKAISDPEAAKKMNFIFAN